MARHTGGWVKLWRSIWEHPIAEQIHGVEVFLWLVAHANRKPTRAKLDGKLVKVPRGSLVTGYREIGTALHVPTTTVFRVVKWIATCDAIGTQAGREGTLVTIKNYDEYQSTDEDDGTQTERKRNAKWNDPGTIPERKRNASGEGEKGRSSNPPIVPRWGTLIAESLAAGVKAVDLDDRTPAAGEPWLSLSHDAKRIVVAAHGDWFAFLAAWRSFSKRKTRDKKFGATFAARAREILERDPAVLDGPVAEVAERPYVWLPATADRDRPPDKQTGALVSGDDQTRGLVPPDHPSAPAGSTGGHT